MDYKFVITNEGAGYRVQLKNEFDRMVSWAWNSNLYAAVLEAVTWELKQSPGHTQDVIKAILKTDFKEIETSLKMEVLKKEFSGTEIIEDKQKIFIKT